MSALLLCQLVAMQVTLGSLEDGVQIVQVKPLAGATMASLRVVVRAGGLQDPPGKSGLAHLLEHLIFHGTYDTPEGGLWDAARAAGADVNAYTSSDLTVY